MSRDKVRELKRAMRSGSAATAGTECDPALALLERSITFGHTRLAVIRLAGAAQAGSMLAEQHWKYCEDVARGSQDPALSALFERARQVAGRKVELVAAAYTGSQSKTSCERSSL